MKKTPAYRKKSGREIAIVVLRDADTGGRREYPLGVYNSPASREAYHRIIGQWEADGRRVQGLQRQGDAISGPTVDELALRYWLHVRGTKSVGELKKIKAAIAVLCHYHGSSPAADFGPRSLKALAGPMINGDSECDPPRKPWIREYVNQQMARIKRIFKWGVSDEMIEAATYHALASVENIPRGTEGVREGGKVHPIDLGRVEQTKPFLTRQARALVDLQTHTGARAGELMIMRPMDLDRDGDVWIYTPSTHKRAHAGESKSVFIGPRSQKVIIPFLQRQASEFMFSPKEGEIERFANAVSPMNHLNDHYTIQTYGQAIKRACAKAFPFPLCMALIHQDRWEHENRWTPHQLRHTAATRIRARYGLEAAQLMLGHSSAAITDAVYAERDHTKIIAIARDVG